MIGKHKCQRCKNHIEKNIYPLPWKCNAFPNGIPEEKLMYITRDSCIDCNNGIGFEAKSSSSKIMNEFHVNNYVVLILDSMPDIGFNYFVIKGNKFVPIHVYDGKNCVAVESNESFIGETIEFIN